ncbi:YggT family protein [Thioalkalivibrio sulfidiphilus]|uniref:YggT family protein n=1 Tax=Thioalkalivibrio sulfidiphilus TaxID=1033854 RepID=UPI00036C3B89|nr:YggT family protein [Thioalkalivibrio sulfidiphilus]
MPGPLQEISIFLISTLFSLYVIALMLRMLLAMVRADFYNPVSQFLVTVTNPPVRALRRVIPPIGRLDTAVVLLMIALKMLELWLVAWIGGASPGLGLVLVVAVFRLLQLLIYVFMFSIIIEAVMSWFMAGGMRGNPVASLVASLNRPILTPIRSVMPNLGTVDLSPLVAIIGLNILLILLRSIF